jgi:hypothetical protein
MADLYVKAPSGEVVVIDDADAQAAANAGYQEVDEATIRAAQASQAEGLGATGAAAAGLGGVPESYNVPQAFAEKALSAATFGLAPGLDSPESIASGRKFAEERPGLALGAEVVGQLPAALVTGGVGAGVAKAAVGRGLAARAGAAGLDWSLNAAVGGAQTEAEEARLSGEDFSWTDAAVTGLAGEAIGRGAAAGFSKALGASRNLLTKAAKETVARDADASLAKGGLLNDYRVAHHAEEYQAQLSDLAARDLDALETSFEEVSRQDRKRARVSRVVRGDEAVQSTVRAEAQAGLSDLYDALSSELGDVGAGPASRLLKQLDDRMDALADAPSGKRLWRLLDENRQALQEYMKDLSVAYENNPGSAWLSRDGLKSLEAAEKATREALLREDAWGREAAQAQAAYNIPFHEKYFPTEKTIRGQLMFSPHANERGFPVFRGDPAKVKRFFTRNGQDVDGARLAEQFRDYLDGVEAIARAGADDAPAAARESLERVRRLRKAVANAEYVQAAADRTARRGRAVELGAEVLGAAGGLAAAGPVGGAVAFGALRGARAGDFLLRAARKLGLGAGEAANIARLLDRDALPPATRGDVPVEDLVDDLTDPPGRGPSSGPPPSSGVGPVGGGSPPGGGLTPSMRADAARGSWAPSGAPAASADAAADGGESFVDELAPEPAPESLRPGRAARAERPTVAVEGREVGRGQAERLELDPVREAGVVQRREAKRLEALTEGEFRDVVRQLETTGSAEADALAKKLTENLAALKTAGLVVAGAGAAGALAGDEPEGAAGAAVVGLSFLIKRSGLISKKGFIEAAQSAAKAFENSVPEATTLENLKHLVQQHGKVGTAEGVEAEARNIMEAGRDLASERAFAASRDEASAAAYGQRGLDDVAAQLGVESYKLSDARQRGFGKKVSGALGSNDGGWYELPDGPKAYVKFYDSPEQAVSEHVANTIYGRDSAPETRLFVGPDGRVAHVSYDVNSRWSPDEWKTKSVEEVTPAEAKAFVKDFWKDVLLANWDVVGLSGDNLLFLTDADGSVVKRIDNGSSLKYRAQGAEKPPAALAKLTEIEGFFNRDLNPNYAGLLRKAGVQHPYDLVRELRELVDTPSYDLNAKLDGFPDDVRDLVATRFDLLKAYADQLESPRLRRLRENLGASRKLGAGFRGTDDDAFDVVESYKSAAKTRPEGGANALPAPPDAAAVAYTSEQLRAHPGLQQLIEVSKRKLDELSQAQRRSLTDWVGSSRAIRATTSAGLDPLSESASAFMRVDAGRSKATADAFNEAMAQLTVVDPTKHGPLFRFIDLPDKAVAELLQKDDFIVTAPTSTGYIPDPNFGSTEFRFRRVDSAGALIGRNVTESEMILLADSRFRKVGQYYNPKTDGFVFEFEEVPETSASPAWGDVGHLSLGPLALAAGAAADPQGAVEDGVAGELAPAPTGAAAAFGATAALFKQGRAKLVRQTAKRLFSASAEPTLRTVSRLAYSRAQLTQRQEEFQAWQADPNALVERVAEGLRDAPPEAFGAASAGVFAAAAFLREKLPQSAKPNPVALRGAPVAAEAMAKYARYEQAALRPGEALQEAAEARYLSPELLETLQELYPDLLAEVRVEAYQAVREGGPPLSVQAKTQYARLFDGDGGVADPAFSAQASQMVQLAYEEAAQVSPAKTGAGPRPGVSQTAAAVAAPTPWRAA